MPSLSRCGYLLDRMPGHPTATGRGVVYVHRVVLYDSIGPGPHPCYHCGRVLHWDEPFPDGLCVDHLDGDKLNNDPANLVPCCRACNTRVWFARQTHCVNGHEFTEANTYRNPANPTRRVCRACRAARMRGYKKARVLAQTTPM